MAEKHRDQFRKRFAGQPESEIIYRQQCRQVLLCDYENSIPVNTKANTKADLREKWWDLL
jgi:hypothetical protein